MSDKKQQTAYPLRMTPELRELVEATAQENKRSVNAEIVACLESTILKQRLGADLTPAAKAREMSAAFRKNIPAEIKSRIVEEINYAILHGLTTAHVELRDMGLESLPDDDAESLTDSINKTLSDAGYGIEWDGLTSLWIDFG